jgi:hypothetical protein
MTTYTQIARLPQIVPFDPAVKNAWGPPINAAWNAIEQLAAGNGPIDLTGLVSYSVTVANDATDQARQAMLPFVGTTPSPCTVTIPPISRIGWISNATNNIVTVTAGGTTNLNVPVGVSLLYNVTGNAVSVVPIGFAGNGQISGNLGVIGGLTVGGAGSFGGNVVMAGTLAVVGQVVLHALNATSLAVSGNATTGPLSVTGTLGVSGVVTAASLAVTNNLSSGTLGVSGAAVVGSLSVTASVLAGTLGISGLAQMAQANITGICTAFQFITTSDRRAKTDIEDITPEAANIWVMTGRPRTYRMGGRRRAGFVAQEDLASGRGDAVYAMADGRDAYVRGDEFALPGHRLARDYEYDIPYLTKALAGALQRIEALEAAARAV